MEAVEHNEIMVIDSIMGSGKTQWAIQQMNEADSTQRFIYITPFLAEVKRIKESVTNRTFLEPNNANDEGRKLSSLKDLIVQGRDIASTHSLFRTADDELIELLSDSGYTLILDEVMDCVETIKARPSDIERLKSNREIEIRDSKVVWTGDVLDDSRYQDIKMTALAGNLFYYRGEFLVWAFPPSVFDAVSSVYVMTYLFKAQTQKYYFDLYGFTCNYKSITSNDKRYSLTNHDVTKENRQELYGLIDILQDEKMNAIGQRGNAFGVTYLKRKNKAGDLEFFGEVQRNLKNFFQNKVKAKRDDVYYSTLKEVEKTIQPKGYKEPRKKKGEEGSPPKVVIPHNIRATNQYEEKWALAYIFNRYMQQNIKVFFQENGVKVDDDLLAVSDLLQWIYRSRIRNGESINLYLPSSRMRKLLNQWANYEI